MPVFRTLDVHAFDEITEASAYWVGFLMADGWIDRRGYIGLRLATCDRGHIEKFKVFLSSGHAIMDIPVRGGPGSRNVGNGTCQLFVGSKRMCRVLADYGVVPAKTKTAVPAKILVSNRDFWRGLVDGDGCLTVAAPRGRGQCEFTLQLAGTRKVCEAFAIFAEKTVSARVGVYKTGTDGMVMASCAGRIQALRLAGALYGNATLYLERKYEIYQRVLAYDGEFEIARRDKSAQMAARRCSEPDCGGSWRRLGMCEKHSAQYYRMQRKSLLQVRKTEQALRINGLYE